MISGLKKVASAVGAAAAGFATKVTGGVREIKVDTLTTIARVALLDLKPEGTKLCFETHSITYDVDGTGRTFSEHSHKDLRVLQEIVFEALKICPPLQGSPQRELFIHCQSGLERLATTYAVSEPTTSQLMKDHKALIESRLKDCEQAGESEMATSELWNQEDLEFLKIAFKKAIEKNKKPTNDEALELIKSIEAFLNAKDIAYIKSIAS